jgi:hypothetical protein
MRSSWVSISCAIQHDSGGYVERVEIESILHAKAVIYRYNEWYKQKRKYGSLGRMSPEDFFSQALKINPYLKNKDQNITNLLY